MLDEITSKEMVNLPYQTNSIFIFPFTDAFLLIHQYNSVTAIPSGITSEETNKKVVVFPIKGILLFKHLLCIFTWIRQKL